MNDNFEIKFATAEDAFVILGFIKELAEYEKMSDQVITTPELFSL